LAFHLIDEARLKLHPADSVRSAVEALFRLEHGRTPADLRCVIQALDPLLHDPAQAALRRTFTLWIKSLLRRKAGSHSIEDINRINDILEADTMLAERIETWFEEATRKGVQQGVQQGEARLLAKLLERRFGPLSQAVADRLAAASETDLEAWAEAVLAVLSAPTLDAVFSQGWH
jgi:hypothetical protein